MSYKMYMVWSKDLCMPTFEDGTKVSARGEDDAVDEFLEDYWYEYDCPNPPVKFNVQEIKSFDEPVPVGDIVKFEFSELDYSPNFYVYLDESKDVVPTKTEPKITS